MNLPVLFFGIRSYITGNMSSTTPAVKSGSSRACLLFQEFQMDDMASRLGVISFLRHQKSFVQVGRRVTSLTGSISSDEHHVGCHALCDADTAYSAAKSQNFIPCTEFELVCLKPKLLASFQLCYFAKPANFVDIITMQLGETSVYLIIVKGVPVAPEVGVTLTRDFGFYAAFSGFEQKLGNTREGEDNPSYCSQYGATFDNCTDSARQANQIDGVEENISVSGEGNMPSEEANGVTHFIFHNVSVTRCRLVSLHIASIGTVFTPGWVLVPAVGFVAHGSVLAAGQDLLAESHCRHILFSWALLVSGGGFWFAPLSLLQEQNERPPFEGQAVGEVSYAA